MTFTQQPNFEVDCPGAMASAPEWQMLRATAVAVAERAALTGQASERFGAWELCARRQPAGNWPPGTAMVRLSVLHQQRVVAEAAAGLPPVTGA